MASSNSTNITFTTASPGSTTNTSTNVSAAANSPSQEPTSSSSLPTTPSTVSSSRAAGNAGTTTSEEKILSRFTSILLADGSRKKIEVADHFKRLAYLRKEADQLEKTDWQYEGVEQLLGN